MVRRRAWPVHVYNFPTERSFKIRRRVCAGEELVPECGQDSFEWFPDEEELEVAVDTPHDALSWVVAQVGQVFAELVMDVVGGNGREVLGLDVA